MTEHSHTPRWLLVCAVAVVFWVVALTAVDDARGAIPQRGTVAYCQRHAVDVAERACIIRVVFAPIGQARKALRVASCESGLDPRARNGQYLGMFQVSTAWRRDVRGFGPDAAQQAWHARRVVTHPQGGWSHWECQ